MEKFLELREIEYEGRPVQVVLCVKFKREADFKQSLPLLEALLDWSVESVYDIETGEDLMAAFTNTQDVPRDILREIEAALQERIFHIRLNAR